ncbi:hypothetical protein BHE74_00055382 [Ensete ventricosum]|nr:hypothetical protein BHE74_00055382 [Ensete ventricosum]
MRQDLWLYLLRLGRHLTCIRPGNVVTWPSDVVEKGEPSTSDLVVAKLSTFDLVVAELSTSDLVVAELSTFDFIVVEPNASGVLG